MTVARLPAHQKPRIEAVNEEVIVWAASAGSPTGLAMSPLAAVDAAMAMFRCVGELDPAMSVLVQQGSISVYEPSTPSEDCAARLVIELESVRFVVHLDADAFVKLAADLSCVARRTG